MHERTLLLLLIAFLAGKWAPLYFPFYTSGECNDVVFKFDIYMASLTLDVGEVESQNRVY
jgi:hypothetical protein